MHHQSMVVPFGDFLNFGNLFLFVTNIHLTDACPKQFKEISLEAYGSSYPLTSMKVLLLVEALTAVSRQWQ